MMESKNQTTEERLCCYCCKNCEIIETENGDIIKGNCEIDGTDIEFEDLELCSCTDYEEDEERDMEFVF